MDDEGNNTKISRFEEAQILGLVTSRNSRFKTKYKIYEEFCCEICDDYAFRINQAGRIKKRCIKLREIEDQDETVQANGQRASSKRCARVKKFWKT